MRSCRLFWVLPMSAIFFRFWRAFLAVILSLYWIVSLGMGAEYMVRNMEPDSSTGAVVVYSILGVVCGIALSLGFLILGFRTKRRIGVLPMLLASIATLLLLLNVRLDSAGLIVLALAAIVLLGDGFRRLRAQR